MGFYYHQASSDSSPVAVLQPQHLSQPYNMDSNNRPFTKPSPFGQPSPSPAFYSQLPPYTPLSVAGRKRSRDEAADNLQNDYLPSTAAPTQESEEDWEYGEGMILIKPNGFIIDASSQTGTWAEEKAEISQAQTSFSQSPPAIQDRPLLRSHKSQRLDLTATPVIAEEMSLDNGTLIASSPPKTSGEDPTVDAFTIHLGIGWSRISDDEDIQAAARGWARFIENRYPVSEAQIRLQSKGLASYLVEAREGWFLFGEDLKEGRLVSTSLERTFENLKTSPPVFDGEETLVATAETPVVDAEAKQEAVMDDTIKMHDPTQETVMNGTVAVHTLPQEIPMNRAHELHGSAGQDLEMDMDMS